MTSQKMCRLGMKSQILEGLYGLIQDNVQSGNDHHLSNHGRSREQYMTPSKVHII